VDKQKSYLATAIRYAEFALLYMESTRWPSRINLEKALHFMHRLQEEG